MLTAAQILEESAYRAKVPGYTPTFGLRNLNAALDDICLEHDFALARETWNFNFDPSLSSMFGSGPYTLPLNYLRTSGSSGARGTATSAWYLYPAPEYPQAQPLSMTPIDLAEFDLLPKLNSQSTPTYWVTDMGGPLTQRIVLSTVGDVSGTNAIVSNMLSVDGIKVGHGCFGEGIAPGSTVLSIDSTTPGSAQVTLSHNTTTQQFEASVVFGISPLAYVWPPPLSSYPATVRFQCMMPPIVDPYHRTPWFPDQGALITDVASRLCELSDDARATSLYQLAQRRMAKYAAKADDKTNRSQQIQLDARNFGRGSSNYWGLPNTKTSGW